MHRQSRPETDSGAVETVTHPAMNEAKSPTIEDSHRYARQLAVLRQVGLELVSELDLDRLLHSIVQYAIELTGATSGGIYLYRPEEDVLEWTLAIGPNPVPSGSRLHKGEGAAGRVWATGKPLIVDDYSHWEGRAAIYENYGFAAVMAAPIHWHEEFLGVIDVLHDQPGRFAAEDAEMLNHFAAQAAVAIHNAYLFQREREQRRLAEALRQAALVVSSTLDLDEVLDRMLEQVSQVVPCDAANFMRLEGDEVYVAGWWGYDRFGAEEFVAQLRWRLTEIPNLRHMAETGEPLIVPDTAKHPDWIQVPVQAWLRSYAGTPIRARDRIVGFLNVDSAWPGRFTTTHVEALRAFAAQASIAIENTELYQAAVTAARQAEALRQAAQVMGASLDLHEILRQILAQVQRVLPLDTASVLIFPEGKEPLLVTGVGYQDEAITSQAATKLLCDSPILARMTLTLEPVVCDDVRQLEGWRWIPGAEHVRSWLGVPLVVRDELIGVLMLDKAEVGVYGQEELKVAQALAQHAAQAINNARLYQALQRYAGELETRVAERTAELQRRIADAEQLNEAMANLMEDLQQAKALAETTAQRLAEVNADLDSFAYSVSHDLRAPLRAIIGFADALQETCGASLSEKGRRYLSFVIRAAGQMDQLIEDLLTYSRLGRRGVRSQHINLHEIVSDVVEALMVKVKQTGAELHIAKDLPTVRGDPTLLRQIFLNLLDNALTYHRPGTTPRVEVIWQWEGNQVAVGVRDNGIGISAEHHEKIFNVFQRLHTEEEYPGSGVGLAVVKKAVDLLGGQVSVESEQGKGSTFWVRLPGVRGQQAATPAT